MDSLSYEELLTLNRALMERHFVQEVHSTALIGSPILADLHNRVIDRLIEIETDRKGQRAIDQWKEWRRLDETKGTVWSTFLMRIERPDAQKYLRRANKDDARDYLRAIASPFEISDVLMARFLPDSDG